ncbi:MAG: dienelactone hydrolase family protein [Pseudomonadota bacterium]
MSTSTTRRTEWSVHDKTFEGVLALPSSNPKGAVLICHAWGGRGEHEEAFAKRLAGLGYAAMAGDVYGKGVRGTNNEENEALMTPLAQDRAMLQERLRAALSALSEQPEVDASAMAVTGFCFGGLCTLDLARAHAPVKGAAAFHAILAPADPFTDGDITAKVIAFQGFDDPMAGPDDLKAFGEEMTARNADWQLHTYGGVAHAFTNEAANMPEAGLMFDEYARDRSYEALENFLTELFV